MVQNINYNEYKKHLATTAWALLAPLVVACGVKAPTKNINGDTTPSASIPQGQEEQAATKREGSELSGSVALLMPVGMPDRIDQVRLSMARQTPQLESLYKQKLDIEARVVAAEEKLKQLELEKLKQLELQKENNISNLAVECSGLVVGHVCSPISWSGALVMGGPALTALKSPLSSGVTAEQKDRMKKLLQSETDAINAVLDAQLTAAAKSDAKGQQIFPLGVGIPQLQRFDLMPGQYLLLVEVLDSTTGKVYQKGRGKVEILAGKVAEANIKLVPVSQAEGGLIINLNGSPSGFTMNGESKVCPTPTPADICPLKSVLLSESEELWQYSCKALGYQLISCVSNKCQYPIPREGTQLCSGLVK